MCTYMFVRVVWLASESETIIRNLRENGGKTECVERERSERECVYFYLLFCL